MDQVWQVSFQEDTRYFKFIRHNAIKYVYMQITNKML